MYAIAFDLISEKTAPVGNAHKFIREFLEKRGFSLQQRSLYYGSEEVTREMTEKVVCEMAKEFRWLKECVSDIRILERVEADDLMPAVERGYSLGMQRGLVRGPK
jgi:virulence-associated protein VapD